jgi:hypothetical protein
LLHAAEHTDIHDEAESGVCYFPKAPINGIALKHFLPNINVKMSDKIDGAYGPQVCDENYIKTVDIIFKLCADKSLKID